MDPFWEYFPPELKTIPPLEALERFVIFVLDKLGDCLPVVKFQMACFERYGPEGLRTLAKALLKAKELDILTILDGKRGDIASSASQYAQAYLEETAPFPADALTLNPYLGKDALEPFLPYLERGKGCFILVRTSNPSSGQVQDLICDGEPLYLKVGKLVHAWGEPFIGSSGYSSLGAVVGATFPQELVILRKELPHTLFLVPGYGAQGGSEEDVALAFDERGGGAIITSSRQILYAYLRKPFKGIEPLEAVKAAYFDALDKINNAKKERTKR